MTNEKKSINKVFEALSHPARRKILALLHDGSMCASDLASHFEQTKPTMSVHFKKLKEAGLIHAEQQGTSVIYALNLSVLEEVLAGILTLKDKKK